MLNVYLLRHGETQWNADGNRYCGRTDIPLTNNGISQAQIVRDQLQPMHFDAIYSSPLVRAKQTAEIASSRKDIIVDNRLIEIDFGEWESKPKEEFIPLDPMLWERWCKDPGTTQAGGTGEMASTVVNRVNAFYEFVLNKHTEGNILVVGHNGINRFYLAFKLGMPLKNYRQIVQENSAVTLFALDPLNSELTLKLLNSKL